MSEVQTPQAAPAFLNEDAVLDYTLDIRKQMIADYVDPVTGKISGDLDTRRFILQNLDGMERQALGRKKIKVEEKSNIDKEQHRQLVAEILRQAGNGAPTVVHQAIIEGDYYVVPQLPSTIPPPAVVEGETVVGVSSLDYNTFMASRPEVE